MEHMKLCPHCWCIQKSKCRMLQSKWNVVERTPGAPWRFDAANWSKVRHNARAGVHMIRAYAGKYPTGWFDRSATPADNAASPPHLWLPATAYLSQQQWRTFQQYLHSPSPWPAWKPGGPCAVAAGVFSAETSADVVAAATSADVVAAEVTAPALTNAPTAIPAAATAS